MKCNSCNNDIVFIHPPHGAYFCQYSHVQCDSCDIDSGGHCGICAHETKFKSPYCKRIPGGSGMYTIREQNQKPAKENFVSGPYYIFRKPVVKSVDVKTNSDSVEESKSFSVKRYETAVKKVVESLRPQAELSLTSPTEHFTLLNKFARFIEAKKPLKEVTSDFFRSVLKNSECQDTQHKIKVLLDIAPQTTKCLYDLNFEALNCPIKNCEKHIYSLNLFKHLQNYHSQVPRFDVDCHEVVHFTINPTRVMNKVQCLAALNVNDVPLIIHRDYSQCLQLLVFYACEQSEDPLSESDRNVSQRPKTFSMWLDGIIPSELDVYVKINFYYKDNAGRVNCMKSCSGQANSMEFPVDDNLASSVAKKFVISDDELNILTDGQNDGKMTGVFSVIGAKKASRCKENKSRILKLY